MVRIVYFFSFPDSTVSLRARPVAEFRSVLRKAIPQCDSARIRPQYSRGKLPRPLCCKGRCEFSARSLPAICSGQILQNGLSILRSSPQVLRRFGTFSALLPWRAQSGIPSPRAKKPLSVPAVRHLNPGPTVKNPGRQRGPPARALRQFQRR